MVKWKEIDKEARKEGRRGGRRDVKKRGKVRRYPNESGCPILNTEFYPAFERSSHCIT